MTANDSIQGNVSVPSGWESIDGVVVPGREVEIPEAAHKQSAPVAVKKITRHYSKEAVGVWRVETAPKGSVAYLQAESWRKAHEVPADSTAAREKDAAASAIASEASDTLLATEDSAAVAADSASGTLYGLVIENPVLKPQPSTMPDTSFDTMSWIFLGIGVLFCAACLKFKNNSKYLKALVTDLTQTRTRQNAFDETVRETSFLILLNVLWVCCAGILLWETVLTCSGTLSPAYSFSIAITQAEGIGLSVAVASVYSLLMFFAYWAVGNVFSDQKHTSIWVKGAAASLALQTIALMPIALLALCYEPWVRILLYVAVGVFILGKIIFIYKGFRIFFNQISSWMLFLYYLCSLEVVPLILAYLAALFLCSHPW